MKEALGFHRGNRGAFVSERCSDRGFAYPLLTLFKHRYFYSFPEFLAHKVELVKFLPVNYLFMNANLNFLEYSEITALRSQVRTKRVNWF